MIWVINMTMIYIGFLGIGILAMIAKRISIEKSDREKITSLSVVIPFRNEAKRIVGLLESLNAVDFPQELDIEFIFVDDHSTDYTDQVIKSQLKIPFKIIKNDKKGKKHAVHSGIQVTKNKYILSLDADVTFDKHYFRAIGGLKESALTVLPVHMDGKSFFQKLARIEFIWLQNLTFSSLKMGMTLLANGANLIYSKKVYLEVLKERTDMDILSGDDIFLLKAVANSKHAVSAVLSPSITVQTPAPNSWSVLILQRKRWLSKMKGTFGLAETIGAIVLLTYSLGFIVPLFFIYDNHFAIYPIVLKVILDLIFVLDAERIKFSVYDVLALLCFQFWYPFYLIGLAIPHKSKEERWQN